MSRTVFKGEALTENGLCHVVEIYFSSEFSLSTRAARKQGLHDVSLERYWKCVPLFPKDTFLVEILEYSVRIVSFPQRVVFVLIVEVPEFLRRKIGIGIQRFHAAERDHLFLDLAVIESRLFKD